MASVIHIIGDQETIIGFRLAGASAVAVSTQDEAVRAFNEALEDSAIRLLLLTEDVDDMLGERVLKHRMTAKSPFITVIESIHGAKEGRPTLQDLVNDAIGIHLS